MARRKLCQNDCLIHFGRVTNSSHLSCYVGTASCDSEGRQSRIAPPLFRDCLSRCFVISL